MGGERGRVEIGEFPKLGKHMIFTSEGIYMLDSAKLQHMSFEEWVKKA